jgi:glutathione S-transferase
MAYRLYGTPGSLYTAKARSYLIHQGIPFENRAAGERRFRDEIMPRIGRWIIPVLETPEGDLIQDSSDIIAHFDRLGARRYPAEPDHPMGRLICRIFELFGGEGLLRPAMHYRWNFDAENRAFLFRDFTESLAPPDADESARVAIFERSSARMRRAMAGFGVTPASIPLIESSYEEFLTLLDAHLARSPFVLGSSPTLADWGLIGPLYAHLARDPFPQRLMKARAHRVWRWTERMNAFQQDFCGFPDLDRDGSLPHEPVSPTLQSLLRFIAEDYLPEIRAFVDFTNRWIEARPDLPDGGNGLERPGDRVIGQTSFTWRGTEISVNVLPYRLHLLQKIQDCFDDAEIADQARMADVLSRSGLSDIVHRRAKLRIVRRDYLEVWASR